MSYMHPAALAARRKYWTRPDAYRFAAPGTPEAKMPGWIDPSATRVRMKEAQEEEARAQAAAEQEELERELLHLRWEVKKLKLEFELRRFERKYGYNPSQPRVPAGNPDGGQWTSGGSQSASSSSSAEPDRSPASDRQVLSDETPDPIRPGAQYAAIRPRGRGPIFINGQWVQPTPRQEALLDVMEGRSQAALQKVQTILPNWRPQESAYATIDGRIETLRAKAEEAEAKILELQDKALLPGRYAGESIPARGPERSYNRNEREETIRSFKENGCNTCGTRNAGTPSGDPVIDHHPPSALIPHGTPQRLFPQCLSCSLMQGGYVRSLMRQRDR